MNNKLNLFTDICLESRYLYLCLQVPSHSEYPTHTNQLCNYLLSNCKLPSFRTIDEGAIENRIFSFKFTSIKNSSYRADSSRVSSYTNTHDCADSIVVRERELSMRGLTLFPKLISTGMLTFL